MVFQHFTLFETLTVTENIALGLDDERDMRAPLPQHRGYGGKRYGLALDPGRHVHDLAVGERQRVEIVRCLMQNPKLLIMDEPTSVLTPQEVERLFETLRRLAAEGCSILYISHKLGEIMALCQRATVLRQGAVTAQCDPRQETSACAGAHDGRQRSPRGEAPDASIEGGARRLTVTDLVLEPDDPFGTRLDHISLTVRSGEILGIAGVAGQRPDRIAARARRRKTGAQRRHDPYRGPRRGAISGPTGRRARGLAFVPEERLGRGAVAELSLADNALLTAYLDGNVGAGMIKTGTVRKFAAAIVKDYNVVCAGIDAEARSLSGGNMQKFIIGREILQKPRVLIAAHPTWGVDVGAALTIHQALIRAARRRRGGAGGVRGSGRAVRDLRPHRGDEQGPPVGAATRRRHQHRRDRAADGRHVRRTTPRSGTAHAARLGSSRAPQSSRLATYLSPVLAVVLTLIGGALLFALLGRDPLAGLSRRFSSSRCRRSTASANLGVKATPLMLCAIGLAIGFRANVWNIGAEGQFIIGAICGGGVGLFYEPMLGPATLPVMFVAGALGGLLWAAIPALPQDPVQRQRDPDQPDADLCREPAAELSGARPVAQSAGLQFPAIEAVRRLCGDRAVLPRHAARRRRRAGADRGRRRLVPAVAQLPRLPDQGDRPDAAGGDLCRLQPEARHLVLALLLSGALAGIAGLNEVAGPIGQLLPAISPGYGFTAIIVAFLGRLHPFGILLAGFLIALSYLGGEAAQISLDLPVAVVGVFQGMLLFFLLACELLVRYRVRVGAAGRRKRRLMHELTAILVSMVLSATPLLFAATGELVTEKSGVLNLGIEGMMIVGAVVGFAVTASTGTPCAWLRRARRLRGCGHGRAVRPADPVLPRQPGRHRPGADDLRHRPLGADRQAVISASRCRACRNSTFPAFPTFR